MAGAEKFHSHASPPPPHPPPLLLASELNGSRHMDAAPQTSHLAASMTGSLQYFWNPPDQLVNDETCWDTDTRPLTLSLGSAGDDSPFSVHPHPELDLVSQGCWGKLSLTLCWAGWVGPAPCAMFSGCRWSDGTKKPLLLLGKGSLNTRRQRSIESTKKWKCTSVLCLGISL